MIITCVSGWFLRSGIRSRWLVLHPAVLDMAKEISNGTHTVKLYNYVDRGRKMHQIAYYEAGRRKLRNFSVKSEAETAALHVLHQLTDGTEAARAFRTPELDSVVTRYEPRERCSGSERPLGTRRCFLR